MKVVIGMIDDEIMAVIRNNIIVKMADLHYIKPQNRNADKNFFCYFTTPGQFLVINEGTGSLL